MQCSRGGGDGLELVLDTVEFTESRPRQREAEQRHHPVDLDVDHPLHGACRLRPSHANVQRQPAAASVGTNHEVGEEPGGAVEH